MSEVTEAHPPEVTFSYIPDSLGDDERLQERIAFWDSPNTVKWFKSHGYTLYYRTEPGHEASFPVLPFQPCSEANYPYAWYDEECASDEDRLCAFDFSGKVAFAQDSLGREVVIKLVRAERDKFRVLELLSKQSMGTLKDNCVIPVLDMLPIEGFWFVVMPRWGDFVHIPSPTYLYEVLIMMRSVLKGLAFLHANGIAHGDLGLRNVLVNHYSNMDRLVVFPTDTRADLRAENCLIYALFDFDHSVIIPPGMKREDFRLPYWRSWRGRGVETGYDTAGGEFDYDPFVFDVGMLGAEFCTYFQPLTPTFPMLAPLLDMMIMRHLDRRFTASQALQFLEEASSGLLEPCRPNYIRVRVKLYGASFLCHDRWKDLPPEFVEKWKYHKETPVPWATQVLCRFCQRDYICHYVPRTRRFFFRLFFVPRTFLQWFISSFRQVFTLGLNCRYLIPF